MKSKGQIWVSAVLYIALGMIVITLILSAGVPLVNKMRDRNTIAQTKRVMFDINDNIEAVANEAKGSARFLSPVDIGAGELFIGQGGSNKIEWRMKTKNRMMEPSTPGNPLVFTEGDLNLELETTAIEGEYEIILYLDYGEDVDLVLAGDYQNPLQGRYSFSIRNKGAPCEDPGCPLEIEIRVT